MRQLVAFGALCAALAAPLAPAHAIMPEFYIGIHASRAASTIESWDLATLKSSHEDATFAAGMQAGFDVGLLGLFAGVVGDVSVRPGELSAYKRINPSATLEYGLRNGWQATLRARAGMDFGILRPYLTAGLAAAGISAYRLDKTTSERLSVDEVQLGLAAGAGLEASITPSLRVHAEYLGYRFGDTDLSNTLGWKADFTDHQIRLGISFVLNP